MEVPGGTLFPKGLESGSLGQREKNTQGIARGQRCDQEEEVMRQKGQLGPDLQDTGGLEVAWIAIKDSIKGF